MRRSAVLTALVALLVALFAGCGREDGAGPSPSPRAEAPEPAEATPRQPGRVEVVEGRVTLAGGAVPRALLLEELAEKAGFGLEVREIDLAPLTLELREVAVEEALARILEGLPYGIHYAIDPVRERHGIALVRVGPAGGWTLAGVQQGVAGESPAAPPDATERASQPDPALDALRAKLGRGDAEARVEMVAEIVPDGAGLDALLELLARDPDPGVRAAAARQLGNGEGFTMVQGLLEALDDPEPAVVLAALEGIEDTADETLVRRLQPLLRHPDSRVRTAAADAIEFLGA